MRLDPQRTATLLSNLSSVRSRIATAASHTHMQGSHGPRLIAVSKLKPASDILALHTGSSQENVPGHLDFGENYAQELTEKAAALPRAIRWHFIGALQSNKCRPLAESVPNLYCVASVDSVKKADKLEEGRAIAVKNGEPSGGDEALSRPLRVLVQVNTSGEESKSGVSPDQAAGLCRHVREQCPHLTLGGLMTIGAIARSQATTAETENEDFDTLKSVRDAVVQELGLDKGDLQLSMGMSSDFEAAIRQGSDEVRVGTAIFGDRPPKKEATGLVDVGPGATT